ncbi:uncharacterized histidine-rich protein DDB_G0274557-like, partial [Python bivittatus]|uniref:Uncharacterized histidine-rich protein DDB_G0274557-like n=1 Tax=Python bivittatus TaxID=176946 RepID=A0A9F5J2S9_PYTBI
ETGLCQGSVVNSQIENRKFVTVECNFFPRPSPVTDEQTPQSRSEPGQEEHHDDSERHRDHHEEDGHHHQHSRPHHHKHGHKHEHQEPHHPHSSDDITETLPEQKETVGRVIVYPSSRKHVSLHYLPEAQEPNPTSNPNLSSLEQEASTHSAKPARPALPPFPSGFSEPAKCPGDLLIEIHELQLPLTPQAATSQTLKA